MTFGEIFLLAICIVAAIPVVSFIIWPICLLIILLIIAPTVWLYERITRY